MILSEACPDFDLAQNKIVHPGRPSSFVQSCADNDLAYVERRIRAGEDLNQTDNSERDCRLAGERMVATNLALYQNGMIPTWRQSGLGVAMLTHNATLLRMLAKAGADLYGIPKGGYLSATDSAIAANFPDGLRILRDEFGHILKPRGDLSFNYYISDTIWSGDSGIYKNAGMLAYFVEECGLDIHSLFNGRTIVDLATHHSTYPAHLEYCYQKGCSPNQQIDKGGEPNRLAFHPEAKRELVGNDEFKLTELLTQYERYLDHTTPLNRSVFEADIEKIRIHLRYDADPLFADSFGENAFDVLDNPRLKECGLYRPAHDIVFEMLDQHILERPATRAPRSPDRKFPE